MKILATAKPNKKYRWRENVNFTIEARHINNQVRYYAIHVKFKRCLTEKIVRLLFPERLVKNCPFLSSENQDFYTVLNRNKKKFKDKFKKLEQNC